MIELGRASFQKLLATRICDLGLEIAGSGLEPAIEQLYAELAAQGWRQFRPKVYLGDEWFSPEGVPAIAIPFYLAHPRLRALEQRLMHDVEGGTHDALMRLLRHEAGHCVDHAYRVSRRQSWRKLFGSPSQEYHPEGYRPRPYSRSFVRHLDNWYAQAHPDEDFAETFAVWLDPASEWRTRYADWKGALAKLEYVDRLARELGQQSPRVRGGEQAYRASRLRLTLEKYYQRRRRENATDYPDFYDDDLRHLFGERARPRRRAGARRSTRLGAALYLTQHRKRIIDAVAGWTGERKYTVDHLVRKLTARARALKLSEPASLAEGHLEVAAYLATLVTHYLFTGKFKRTV